MAKEVCEDKALSLADYRFSRKQLREYSNISNAQLKLHLERLVDYEYLRISAFSHAKGYEYEILYDGETGQSKSLNLISIEDLKCKYDRTVSG